jgi:hypothetical protein
MNNNNTLAETVSPAIAHHVLNYFGYDNYMTPSGFHVSLLDAMTKADSNNFEKLASVFPQYADALGFSHMELKQIALG